uniref:Uncharacterized protein n=1 Tax=Mustela putorius furo TaxID=9669 RepID=M3XWC6_MUSPF
MGEAGSLRQLWGAERRTPASAGQRLGSPPKELQQGSAPPGCCSEPPVPGCAAGGPPPEGLGRPGFRHRGGTAAASSLSRPSWGHPGHQRESRYQADGPWPQLCNASSQWPCRIRTPWLLHPPQHWEGAA